VKGYAEKKVHPVHAGAAEWHRSFSRMVMRGDIDHIT